MIENNSYGLKKLLGSSGWKDHKAVSDKDHSNMDEDYDDEEDNDDRDEGYDIGDHHKEEYDDSDDREKGKGKIISAQLIKTITNHHSNSTRCSNVLII